jgi:ADP-ribose pyrophosphatase
MHKNFTVLSQKNLFKGYFRIDRYKICYQKFNGEWTDPVNREVFERGNAVAVLPYDPIRNEVVLIEQFRIGAIGDSTASPWLFEIVAGIIEPDESLEAVALRGTRRY